MDRSFLGFKQLLLRLISGPDRAKPATRPVRRAPDKSHADHQDGWTRLEL